MRIDHRPVGIARARVALAVCVVFLASSPVLAAGPRLTTPKQKTLIETDHFGTFYAPQIMVAGRTVVAIWRGPNQTGTVRTIATSKDGGATFTYKLKPARIPVLSQLFAVAADPAGNIYLAGTTAFANQIAVVRTDAKFKTFSAGTLFDLDRNAVGIDMAVATDGTLYLAYQVSYSTRISGGVQTQVQQVRWASSTDQSATFTEFAPTFSRPADFSDVNPTLVPGPNGAMFLLAIRDDTVARAAVDNGTYTGGSILVTKLEHEGAPGYTLTRQQPSDGRLVQVEGFVAEDSTLGVAWAEHTIENDRPVQNVYFARVPVDGGTAVLPSTPVARVGSPHEFNMARTSDRQVALILFGAGFDSNADEPAIIGLASTDDGVTFGAVKQVTDYPPVTTLSVTTDGRKIYGLWTDTRIVRFSGFQAKPE